jgi:hypothetical protein
MWGDYHLSELALMIQRSANDDNWGYAFFQPG